MSTINPVIIFMDELLNISFKVGDFTLTIGNMLLGFAFMVIIAVFIGRLLK